MKKGSFVLSFSKAFFAVLTAAVIFCPKVYAIFWTENNQATFGDGYYVINRTTASADNTVEINQVYDWYNSNWLLRRPITIDNTNSSSALTNYQQTISVNTQDLIADGAMRTDIADIRFTDSDGKTLINYYIATDTNTAATTPATIVVKIPSVPASQTKTIFMYFDNSSTSTSLSSAKNTYDLYENWESGSINNTIWQTGVAAPFSVVTSSKYQGNYSARSGAISPGGVSYIQTTINLDMAACVTFYWAVSSQPIYDYIDFYIDGYEGYASDPNGATFISGEQAWVKRVYYISTTGLHTLKWQFQRSSQGGTQGQECGWVDNIVVCKQATIAPSVSPGTDESYSVFYREGIYQSNVLDAVGQQAQVLFASWTAITNGGTSLTMRMRSSDTQFAKGDTSPAWSLPISNNAKPSLDNNGRFIQYQATLDGDGTTTPYLVEVSINYVSPPPLPTNFYGVALSSTSIQWNWTDNSSGMYEEDGFSIFSTTGGVMATLPPDTTYYTENALDPNEQCSRWLTVFNSSGTNTTNPTAMYTKAHEPNNHAEEFNFLPGDGYSYTTIPTGTAIFKSTFTITSDSTTPAIEYYRVAFTTDSAHSFSTSDTMWVPHTSTVSHPDSGNTIVKKPEITFNTLYNNASWYFYAQTYNHLDVPSGVTTLGPFNFQGCPSAITDLTAAPSSNLEGSIVLTWTAPSADGSQITNLTGGKYVIKARSTYLILTDSDFNGADMSFIISTSAVAGQRQSFTLAGLAPGAQWGFAIKSVDSDNNVSQLSTNVISSTCTRNTASAITKIVFLPPSQTTYVGKETSNITIETMDANNYVLNVASDVTVNLHSDSALANFGQGGTWGLSSVIIHKGLSNASFQYKDTASGNRTITAQDSNFLWASGSQTETIIPAKAVRFMIDYPSGNVGNVGTDQNITIRANDGYNDSNFSSDYQGDVVVTCTVAGITITPSTYTFTAIDSGHAVFTIGNKGDNSIAGPATYSVQEVVTQDYSDVLNGMLVGNGGIIRSRDDSGRWFTQKYSSGAANGLYGLSSPDGTNIWASGAAGRVAKSTDAGDDWTSYATGLSSNLNGVYFVNVSTGWAAGDGGNIVKSVDGGQTWSAQVSGVAQKLRSVFFVNVSTGWAAGDSGTLLKTVDSGQTWQSASLGTGNLNKMFFCGDSLTGFIAADGGKIYKTQDCGATWTPQTTPVTSSIYSVNFFSPTLGYAAGASNTVLRTVNGGSTWSLVVSTAATPDFYGVSFVGSNSSLITAVGTGGSILQTTDGTTWSTQVMSGVSTPFIWNALAVNNPVVQTQRLVQGKINPGIYLGVATSNSGISSVDQIRVKKSAASTCDDSDITSIVVYLDSNRNGVYDSNDTKLGEAPLISGQASINISRTFTQTTDYLLVMPNVAITSSGLGKTFGMELDFSPASARFLDVQSGVPFAKNNLPFTMSAFSILPSSCTVDVGVGNLSPTEVIQGQRNVLISSFTMIADRGDSPWQQFIVKRSGVNNTDSDIEDVKLYKSPDQNYNNASLIATTAFGAVTQGLAKINISPAESINNITTNYYFLTADISPTAVYYTSISSANFQLSFGMATSYFILDGEGANGVQSTVSISSFTSNVINIKQALNTLVVAPVPGLNIDVDQSKVASLQTLRLYVTADGARVDITKVHVTETGTAADSDVTSVLLYKDTNGTGVLDTTTDALLGSAVLSSNQGDIVLATPETINKTLSSYATYFIAASVSKRATVGVTIQLKINSTDITLAGINVVSTANFPVNTAVATIQNYRDVVNVTCASLAPREARVDETGIFVSKMKLWAYCSAVLTNLTLELTGTGSASNINAIKLYANTDGNDVYLSTDTLIGSGTFGSDGKSAITLTTQLTVYDSSATIFVVYDLNPSGAYNQTVGMGVSDSSFIFPGEGGANHFGYYQTGTMNLLRKETPSVPQLALNIGCPSGKQVGGETLYFSNQPSSLEFTWQSQALNGVVQAKYAMASFSVFSTTDVPDLTGWSATSNTDALMQGLNMKHNTLYYLWVKAVSTDGFERVTCVPVLIDLLPPSTPSKPTDTSPKAKSAMALSNAPISSYWVSWSPASDPVSGIWYYVLQERTDTSPVWHTISTTTAAEYNVVKNTATDAGKFFYYRVTAMNYAGSLGTYSDSSLAAYLSLPSDFVKDLASYPNPFDSRRKNATIAFVLNQDATINFKVFDLFGKLVKDWQVSGTAGDNTSTWDGTDDGGRKVAAGMYILYAEIQGSSQTEKKRYKIGVIH